MKPSMSAPASTAASTSSWRVRPQTFTSGREIEVAELRLRVGRLHERGADEHGVGAGELCFGRLGARVDGALGDHEVVGLVAPPSDKSKLLVAVDRERREVARVDADDAVAETHCAVELLVVVCLDERVETDVARRTADERRRRLVVEVAEDEERGVGARLAHLAQLLLGREEALREQRQRLSLRARRAGRRCVPPKRSSTRTEMALAPPRSYAGTMSSTRASGRMSPIDGERRLNSAIAESRRPDSASWKPHVRENSTSSSSRAAAAPESSASRACSRPSRMSSASLTAAIPPAALRSTAERWPPSAPREHVAQRRGVRRRIAAAQLLRRAALDPEVERIELVLADLARVNFAHEVRAARRELVDPARAVHDVRARHVELDERRGERPRELGRVDAEDERPRAGGVRERAEHVEHGTRGELAPDGRRVAHRRMVRLREEEAEAELVDRPLDLLRGQLELEAERLEHVRRAGLRRRGAVAVLRDRRSRRRRDEGRRGRDVVRVRAVAAGADDIDDVGALRVDAEDVLAHRLGAARDLVRRLALRAQRDEEAGDLRLRRLAAHDLAHRRARLVARQVVAVEQARDDRLDHSRPARKLRASAGPSGVSTDSGWNWTPTAGSSRCRTAITSPSSANAVGSSTSGSRVAASEW